jgi:hypothetical protein
MVKNMVVLALKAFLKAGIHRPGEHRDTLAGT